MEDMQENEILIKKLVELNRVEIKKSKVLAVIFQKTTQRIIDSKVKDLEDYIKDRAKFFNQKIEDYQDTYQNMINKYKEQLDVVIDEYNKLYVNIYFELQEAECNQKIAIANLKKSCDLKRQAEALSRDDLIEEYSKKIDACIQKKINYDIIIQECEEEQDRYIANMERKINMHFSDKNMPISSKNESMFIKILNKIKNIIDGKTRFNTDVIEVINVELEVIDGKLKNIIKEIEEEMIIFIAKIKQAKAETNEIFNLMI